jgi:hypothetical protein
MDKFFLIIYNGLKQVKLPLLGFTDLSLWDFLLSFFIASFVFSIVARILGGALSERRGLTGSLRRGLKRERDAAKKGKE